MAGSPAFQAGGSEFDPRVRYASPVRRAGQLPSKQQQEGSTPSRGARPGRLTTMSGDIVVTGPQGHPRGARPDKMFSWRNGSAAAS